MHDTVSNSTFPLHCPQVQHLNTSAETNTLREKNGNFTSRPVYALDAQRLAEKGLLMTMINGSFVKGGTIHWEFTRDLREQELPEGQDHLRSHLN